MEDVELRADLAPDADFFGKVFDLGRAEPFQAVLAAQLKQFFPPANVVVVAEAGVSRFEFEFIDVRRHHHRERVDLAAVFDEFRVGHLVDLRGGASRMTAQVRCGILLSVARAEYTNGQSPAVSLFTPFGWVMP